jgi:hypothetical protein
LLKPTLLKMGNKMKTAKLIFIFFASLVFLAACGGGGESLSRDQNATDSSATTPDNDTFTIAMSILDQAGSEETQLSEGAPLNVNTRVLDASGDPVSGLVVNYALSETSLADFSNDTGTALTNSDGIATIQMTVGSLSGSGTVTAGLENSISVTLGFNSLGTSQATPSSLELYANSVQLASSGGDEIELIAVAKNEQNILLKGIAVSFSADENASLSNIDTETGDDGTARATLTTQNNKKNRAISVVATTAGLSETLKVNVVGTEVNVNGPVSVIINDSAPVTIVLSDSDGVGIANQTVVLTSTMGVLYENNSVNATNEVTVSTGANGQVTVNFLASQAGESIVSASVLGESNSIEIKVQQDDFSFYLLPTDSLDVSEDHLIGLRWYKNNVAFENGSITVTTSRGIINGGNNTATTNADGLASFLISSEYAGPASVSAIGIDSNGNEVTARATVEFKASTVDSIFVDGTPDLIGPEGQTATITAVIRDEKGNLVKDQIVNFRLVTDASGGSISPNSAKTDSNGIASSVYTSNGVSGDNGVTIEAESNNVVGSTDLTVGDRAFDISLGTGSVIEIADNSTYLKEFAVFVTDASGRPVSDAELTATVTPTMESAYFKGAWYWDETDKIHKIDTGAGNPLQELTACTNEDVNQDGRLEPKVLDANGAILENLEDRNEDDLLTPGNVASISFKDNVSRTDEFGQATIQVRYPKQFAVWSRVIVSVLGQSAGSESKESQVYSLGIASADLTDQASPPPNSPFGLNNACESTY